MGSDMKRGLIYSLAILLLLAGSAYAACQPYAFEGAYARYSMDESTAIGSFSGEVRYDIIKVWCSNSTMLVKIKVSGTVPGVSQGTHEDDINDPSYFPAIPVGDLGKSTLLWKGKKYNLVETKGIEVPAGGFTVYHYRYTSDSEKYDLYVDTSTGLIIKLVSQITVFGVKTTTKLELYDTNIRGMGVLLLLFVALVLAGAVLAILLVIFFRHRKSERSRQWEQRPPQQYGYTETEEMMEPQQQ